MPPLVKLQIVIPAAWDALISDLIDRGRAMGFVTTRSELAREILAEGLPAFAERIAALEASMSTRPVRPRVVVGSQGPVTLDPRSIRHGGPGRRKPDPTRPTKKKTKKT